MWVQEVARIEDEVLAAFRGFSAADVSDAVGALYTMSPSLRPLYEPMGRLVGRALTVKAPPGDSLAVHGAVSVCEPGDVLVVDWRGYVDSSAGGGGMLVEPIQRGLAGIVVDGAWRDVPDLKELNFPIFGRGTCSTSRAKTQLGEINVPVCCGGVIVNAGDLIIADAEAIVAVPRDQIAGVRAEVERVMRTAPPARASRKALFQGVFEAAGGVTRAWHEAEAG
ncbi:MAG TPA: hypothetical protein VK816_08920 [Jatrophihabitantaceae bacterium]|nr:hypothetical protein [Jatrophihabitantaceae bacterium]